MDTNTHLHAELVSLRNQLDDANALIRDLRGEDSDVHFALMRALGLSSAQADFMACLLRRERMTYEAIYAAMYGSRLSADQPGQKILGALVCATRKKIKPYGIEIRTVFAIGFELPSASVAKIRELIAPHLGLPRVDAPPLAPVIA